MSIKLMSQVWEQAAVNGSELLVLLALADYANGEDICWPSLTTLSKRARVTERQVQRIVQSLEAKEHIEVLERGNGAGHSTKYKLTIKGDIQGIMPDESLPDEPQKGDIQGNDATQKDDIQRAELAERMTSSTQRVTSSAQKVDIAMSPDPTTNHHIEPTTETEEEIAADAAPPSWAEYLEAYCWICHGHKKLSALTKEQKGALCSEAKRVHSGGFTIDDLRAWFKDVWQNDWRWTKRSGNGKPQHERPKPSDVRSMIPAIREPEQENKPYQVDAVDIPGVYATATNGQAPPLAAPLGTVAKGNLPHDDPWAIAVAELMPGMSSTSAGHWLTGSRLEANGELAGVPFYRVVLTEPGADALWMTQQAEPAIRKKLASLLGKRISLEITVAERMPV